MSGPVSRRKFLHLAFPLLTLTSAGCAQLSEENGSPDTVDREGSTETSTTIPSTEAPTETELPMAETASSNRTEAASTQLFETPTPGSCETANLPSPLTENEFSAREYPDYPDSISESTAASYAITFERAYQYNSYLQENQSADTEQIDVIVDTTDRLTSAVDDGYELAVEGKISILEGGDPEIVSDNPVVGIYRLSSTYGFRGEIQRSTLDDIISLNAAAVTDQLTIHC